MRAQREASGLGPEAAAPAARCGRCSRVLADEQAVTLVPRYQQEPNQECDHKVCAVCTAPPRPAPRGSRQFVARRADGARTRWTCPRPRRPPPGSSCCRGTGTCRRPRSSRGRPPSRSRSRRPPPPPGMPSSRGRGVLRHAELASGGAERGVRGDAGAVRGRARPGGRRAGGKGCCRSPAVLQGTPAPPSHAEGSKPGQGLKSPVSVGRRSYIYIFIYYNTPVSVRLRERWEPAWGGWAAAQSRAHAGGRP